MITINWNVFFENSSSEEMLRYVANRELPVRSFLIWAARQGNKKMNLELAKLRRLLVADVRFRAKKAFENRGL